MKLSGFVIEFNTLFFHLLYSVAIVFSKVEKISMLDSICAY